MLHACSPVHYAIIRPLSQGYCFCLVWIALCMVMQLATVTAIADNQGLDSSSVTSELVVLWVLTFVVDFFLFQPIFFLLRQSWAWRHFDPSWALAQANLDWAQYLYSLQ